MKSKVIFIMFILSISLSFSQQQYFVSKDGTGNFSTIAQVNSASLNSGDIVAFKGGEQFADALLKCKTGVTYTSFGNGQAIIGDSTASIDEITIQISYENVILDNLKIYGYANGWSAILYTMGGLMINNCNIVGGRWAHEKGMIGIYGGAPITTGQIKITNNTIHDFAKGAYFQNPYNIDFSYNTVYNMYVYNGYQAVGGTGISAGGSSSSVAFDCAYTFHIHHNEFYNYEHSAMWVGAFSRVLVEYNYIHDNLDERLYMGGISHGTVGKFFDCTGFPPSGTPVGSIFRYNYVYNIQRRGLPGYTYERPTIENIKAGIPNIVNSTGTNLYPIYITSEGGAWDNLADGVLSGLGYGNHWIHNNIFYKSTHQVTTRGYTKFLNGIGDYRGEQGPQRADLASYFINNTVVEYGTSSISNLNGIIYTEETSASPIYVINNILDMNNDNSKFTGYYKEVGAYVDYNIYPSRNGTTTTLPDASERIATYFPYAKNEASGSGEKYFTDPNFNQLTASYFASNIGPAGVYLPDFRLSSSSSAISAGMDYDLIGDIYADAYGNHVFGKDPTGRSFAYDILGNLRTTNDIGAVGIADSPSIPPQTGLRLILEGSYINGKMKTGLNTSGFFPLKQPYSVEPWNVYGDIIINSAAENYVDWILVQVRDDLINTKYWKVGILTDDGTVLNPDGSSFSFMNLPTGEYYLVIKHRNHLSIMSAQKVLIEKNKSVEYDFTDSQSKTYGENSMVRLDDGKYAMIAGDGDANGVINVLDFGTVANNILLRGYTQGDTDMNGSVNVLDYSFINRNLLKTTNLP